MPGKRAPAVEIDRRVTLAYDQMIQGKASGTIARVLSEELGVTPRQVEEYMAKARKRLVELYKVKREQMAAAQLAKLENIAELATADRQYAAAVGAVAAANRMLSLDPGKG